MAASRAISIGNFDGVHRGHAALIAAARAAVGPDGAVTVLAFNPHPVSVLRPEAAPERLTHFDRRVELLHAAGADEVIPLQPTPELLNQEPRAFLDDIVNRFAPQHIIEGPDFCFGRNRAGCVDLLKSLEPGFGYRTTVIEPIEQALTNHHLVAVSSSMIRRMLRLGRVRDAARLLGRPYMLCGTVEPGEKRGRTLNVPTANVEVGDQLLPADGIYAGSAQRDGGPWSPAAISIGCKPTFNGVHRVCEVHFLDSDCCGPADQYGWALRVKMNAWLRDQIRFTGVGALQDQLQRDIARVAALETTSMCERS
jgi:riboflavin kinase/FMN adenylyltransferase